MQKNIVSRNNAREFSDIFCSFNSKTEYNSEADDSNTESDQEDEHTSNEENNEDFIDHLNEIFEIEHLREKFNKCSKLFPKLCINANILL